MHPGCVLRDGAVGPMPRRRPSHPTTAYAEAVVSGKIVTGRYVRLACERHLRDLKRKDLRFDEETATRAIDFFPDMLRFTKGEHKGKPFVLQPWQCFIVGSLFGWKRPDGLRRFRSSLILVAKKSGKSEMMAGIGLYGLVADGEGGAEIYSAATTRDQASLVWRAAKEMRDQSPELREYVGASERRDAQGNPSGGMYVTATGSSFMPLGRDRDTVDGKNPHIVVIDELHRHKNRDLYDVLTASNIARTQPLAVAISTAGAEAAGVCWDERRFAIQVLEGATEKDDFFAYLAELDEGDDWEDETAWPKSNPNLGVSISLDALRGKYQKAKASGPDRAAFIRYHGNRYTADPEETFIMPEVWTKCAAEPVREGPCFVGVDLSARNDWCAMSMYWPETHSLDWRFFLPSEDLIQRAERDRVPIQSWVDDGYVTLCPGPVIDGRVIREHLTGIRDGKESDEVVPLIDAFKVVEVAVDRALATQLLVELSEDGLTVAPFGQGFLSMSPAARKFEELALAGKFRHGGHPIARWMLSNTRVIRDAADNIKPVKWDGKQGRRRIDGIVAAIMAVGRAVLHEGKPRVSVYEERGIIELG